MYGGNTKYEKGVNKDKANRFGKPQGSSWLSWDQGH
jgi:hypothetical protein